MIYKFSAKNFYSFKETIEITFEVGKNAPNTGSYIYDANNTRLSKIISVIGANASGKTNLLKVLPFLAFLITDSYTDLKPNDTLPFENYRFMPKNNFPTELSVTFQCKEILYEYFVRLNKNQILEEKLRRYSNSTKKFNTLFNREWNQASDEYSYFLRNFRFPAKLTTKRKNATLIAIAAQSGHKLSEDIIACWNQNFSNVIQYGKHLHPEAMFYEAAEFYANNLELHKKANSILSKYDLGLSRTKIIQHQHETKSGKKETVYLPYGVHPVKDKEYPLEFYYESTGTQNLFVLLRQMLPVLETGGIVVLDEFDADLHPLMLPELVDMFASKQLNPKNAQLLFSTHHHEILNKLDKYQIVLVEKNKSTGQAEVWRLDEVQGVGADDNYYSKYIAGVYKAIPEI